MSSTTHTPDGMPVRRGSGLLYPTLLIAGFAVIIASILGIAAMTGVLPQAQSQTAPAAGSAEGPPVPRATAAPEKNVHAPSAAVKKAPPPAMAARCGNCGVVDRVRAVEAPGRSSAVGAVAGGVVGGLLGNQVGRGRGRTAMTVVGAGAGAYAGNEIEKNMNKSVTYEIRVRMDDDSYRTFHAGQPEVDVGQRVRIRDGRLERAG